MATVAGVQYTCPTCSTKYVSFVQAQDGTAFLVSDAWCVACENPVKMDKAFLGKTTSDALNTARSQVGQCTNQQVANILFPEE